MKFFLFRIHKGVHMVARFYRSYLWPRQAKKSHTQQGDQAEIQKVKNEAYKIKYNFKK